MVQIRKVQPQEGPVLQQVSIRCFEETFAADNDPQDMANYLSREFNLSKLLSELQNTESAFYFAVQDDEVCGYLKINTGEAQTEKMPAGYLEIERIYVFKEHQGSGMGLQLLQQAFSLRDSWGYSCVWLGVWEHNRKAIRFYERHGFKVFGLHDFVLGKDVQKDLLMKNCLPANA